MPRHLPYRTVSFESIQVHIEAYDMERGSSVSSAYHPAPHTRYTGLVRSECGIGTAGEAGCQGAGGQHQSGISQPHRHRRLRPARPAGQSPTEGRTPVGQTGTDSANERAGQHILGTTVQCPHQCLQGQYRCAFELPVPRRFAVGIV